MVPKRKTTKLRELLSSQEMVIIGGTGDAFEAKIAEAAGFKACCMPGGRTAAVRGFPDVGLVTMTEVVANAHFIATAIDVPLICDSDTGYGNAYNVIRTVKEFIYAGAAGIHLEDQVSPKRCGYMPGKQIIEIEEAVGKYRAAADARNDVDPDFIIIARTDAIGSVGGSIDEAVRRMEAYRKAGADVSYVEGISSIKELRFIVERVEKPILLIPQGIPLEERPSEKEFEKMGISCLLYPAMIYQIIVPILWEYLHDVKDRGWTAQNEWLQRLQTLPQKYSPAPLPLQIVGFSKVKEWEKKYLPFKEMEKYEKSKGIAWGKGQ